MSSHTAAIESLKRWIALRKRLIERRTLLGLSRRLVADRCGVTESAVEHWEKGRREPGIANVFVWAAAVGVTISYEVSPDV